MFDWRMIESVHVLIDAAGPASARAGGGADKGPSDNRTQKLLLAWIYSY